MSMKNTFPFLLLCLPLLLSATEEGDYENRLRAAELSGNRPLVKSICQEWYASGKYSPGMLNWNYNALMSVDDGAVLVTQQESDTYPALMLQNALNVRPDVCIINRQLIENQDYRNQLIHTWGLNWVMKNSTAADFLKELLQPFQKSRPVFLGSMFDPAQLSGEQQKLYLTGLALKFSQAPFDNVAVLKSNYETRFRTDYLDLDWQPETDTLTVERANLNYLPAFLLLHQYYSDKGETEKARRLENISMRIARAGGKGQEVETYFHPNRNAPRKPVSDLSARALEKHMKKIRQNLFASETELTNEEYEMFLMDLVKNREFDMLQTCQVHKTDWISLLPEGLRSLPDSKLFANGNPDMPDMPVVNISHEAAEKYCQWITTVYNNAPERKKFKKVVFRLPTADEWMEAANGGRQGVAYPWGGYFIRNSKGCFLANYNVEFEPGAYGPTGANNTDGGYFTVPVASYFPNDLGMYNISGNVAEMIDQPGKTKGGSWMDIAYYGQITTVHDQEAPSPAVGFRVFMEVVEW